MDPEQIDHQLRLAAELCEARGERWTKLRNDVLRLVLEADRPLGAYDLIARLASEERTKVGPPTVYRSLEFLVHNRLIHRLETLNAYVACDHFEAPHQAHFVICDDCGSTEELDGQAIHTALHQEGMARGFKVQHQVVELRGTCADCLESTGSATGQ